MDWQLSQNFNSIQGKVVYDRFGNSGPSLVLVHGTPASSYLWRKVAPQLAKHFTVLVYDMPGYGRSDKYEGQDVRLRTQAKVLAELLAHCGVETPHLVGHDFGAATVLGAHLVEGVPAASLTIIDGVTLNPWGTPYSLFVKENVDIFTQLPGYIHEAAVSAHIRTAVHREMSREDLAAFKAPWLGQDGQAAYYRQVAQYDMEYTGLLEPMYPKITAPTQILWGEEDRWSLPAIAERLGQIIPNSAVHFLPDAGHFLMEDLPGHVTRRIESFVKSVLIRVVESRNVA